MNYRCIWAGLLLAALLVCRGAHAAEPAAKSQVGAVSAALAKAGNNRAEIQAALDRVPKDQAEGMRFLVIHMPQRD